MGKSRRSPDRKNRGHPKSCCRGVQIVTAASRHFDVWMAERSYRYKEEALYSHAPQKPGIYQLVTFDENQNGVILYIGLTLEKSIFDVLYEHWRGQRSP